MPKLLVRIIALLVAACLTADPACASLTFNASFGRAIPFQNSPRVLFSEGAVPAPLTQFPRPETLNAKTAAETFRQEKQARVRATLLFFLGSGLSDIGTFMQGFVQKSLLFETTHAASWLGWDSGAVALGVVVGLPLSSVLADWAGRAGHRIYVVLTASQMVLPWTLGYLIATHHASALTIVGFSFIDGLGQSMGGSLFSRLYKVLRQLQPEERRARLDTLTQVKINFGRVTGPLLGAWASSYVGISGVYYLNALSFAIFAVTLTLMRHRIGGASFSLSGRISARRLLHHWWVSSKEGVQEWRRHRTLVTVYLLAGVAALFGLPLYSLLAAFARDDKMLLAGLQSAYNSGVFLSNLFAFFLGWYLGKRRPGTVMDRYPWIAPMILGSGLIVFGLSNHPGLWFLTVIAAGGAYGWSRVASVNYTNQYAAETHMARVSAIFYFIQHLGQFLGGVGSGFLTKTRLKSSGTIVVLGSALVLISAAFAFFSGKTPSSPSVPPETPRDRNSPNVFDAARPMLSSS